jgi:hypothetical protein
MTANDARTALAARFPADEVQHFTGRGGKVFDYIEDETVMDRLDDVYGVGGWSITVEPISAADGIVKVRLQVGAAVYEDFGYASNSNPESELLKEAVSDGIRRCGRYLGVGRYLYRKHVTTAQNGSGRPAPARPPLRAVSEQREFNGIPATTGDGPDDPYGDLFEKDLEPKDLAVCAQHGEEWRGTPGDLYHKKAEGGYCRHPENVQKPARAR